MLLLLTCLELPGFEPDEPQPLVKIRWASDIPGPSVRDIAFNAEGSRLMAILTEDSHPFTLWRVPDWERLSPEHVADASGPVPWQYAVWTTGGTILAVTGPTYRGFEPMGKQRVRSYSADGREIPGVDFYLTPPLWKIVISPNGRWLAGVLLKDIMDEVSPTVYIYDLQKQKLHGLLRTKLGQYHCMCFIPQDNLYFQGASGSVVYDIPSLAVSTVTIQSRIKYSVPPSCRLSDNGKYLVLSYWTKLTIISLADKKEMVLERLSLLGDAVILEEKGIVLFEEAGESLSGWRLGDAAPRLLLQRPGFDFFTTRLATSPDGRFLAIASDRHGIDIYNLKEVLAPLLDRKREGMTPGSRMPARLHPLFGLAQRQVHSADLCETGAFHGLGPASWNKVNRHPIRSDPHTAATDWLPFW